MTWRGSLNVFGKFQCLVVLVLALSVFATGRVQTNAQPASSQVNSNLTRSPAIVFVRPVFTAAAYRGYPNQSFYGFYKRFSNVSQNTIVKADLNLLNTSVKRDDWGKSEGLAEFLRSKAAKDTDLFGNVTILSDIEISEGKLFDPASRERSFDVAVLGFTEYVTASEYQNYERFVETGGGLFFLDACNFLAEVKYNPQANTVSLVKGHGWEFNGTAAWKGPSHRWSIENTNWVGSNYALFYKMGYQMNGAIANTTQPLSVLLRTAFGQRVFSSYVAHEENAIANSTDKVIAYWIISGLKSHLLTVAVYEHAYQKGLIIHTGIFGSDLISKDKEMQFFLVAGVKQLASQAQNTTLTTTTATAAGFVTSTIPATTPLQVPPGIPGFSWQSIIAGIIVGLAVLGTRRHRNSARTTNPKQQTT